MRRVVVESSANLLRGQGLVFEAHRSIGQPDALSGSNLTLPTNGLLQSDSRNECVDHVAIQSVGGSAKGRHSDRSGRFRAFKLSDRRV